MKVISKVSSVVFVALLSFFSLSSCSSQGQTVSKSSGNSTETEAQSHYHETKSMVLDILHTKEGTDALSHILQDPTFKESLLVRETDMQGAMVKALTEGTGHKVLLQQMNNPQFATALAQAYRKDNRVLLKELMKDPEYQSDILALFRTPDFQNAFYGLMKTPEFRKQTMGIMTQSFQNPQFKLLFMDIVKEAIKQGTEERTPNQKKMAGQSQSQSEQKPEQVSEKTGSSGQDQGQSQSQTDKEEKKNEGQSSE